MLKHLVYLKIVSFTYLASVFTRSVDFWAQQWPGPSTKRTPAKGAWDICHLRNSEDERARNFVIPSHHPCNLWSLRAGGRACLLICAVLAVTRRAGLLAYLCCLDCGPCTPVTACFGLSFTAREGMVSLVWLPKCEGTADSLQDSLAIHTCRWRSEITGRQ